MNSPNVLLIVLDATRQDHLSCYGYHRPTTPKLETLSGDATRYEQAITTAPWTPPSHASMFTGCYPSNHGLFGTQTLDTYDGPTIAEVLSDAGYSTFGFSHSHHTSTEQSFDRGFDFYHDILDLPNFMGKMYEPSLDFARFLPKWLFDGHDISDFQLRKLETCIQQEDEPFFGFINLGSAHSPYKPPAAFKEEFEGYFDSWDTVDEESARVVSEDDGYEYIVGDVTLTETEWDLVKCWYDAEIRYIDHLLGELVAFLKRRKVYDDTMVIVTADHGEHFGEYGLAYHQFSLFEELLNVPLLVKWPSDSSVDTPAPGTVSNRLVSLVDLVPTICQFAGVSQPAEIDGVSLIDEAEHDAVFAEYDVYPGLRDRLREYDDFSKYDRGLQAIRTREHKLVRSTDGEETLYSISDGRESVVNDESVARTLSEQLTAAVNPPPDAVQQEGFDEDVRDHLKEMGYL